ncbi:MAG TPA: YceI family protein [Candidatus Sulfotelmatobacter sp.]|nr:YceI family protein [Candidatus Sulfotelmatobacter sp.]
MSRTRSALVIALFLILIALTAAAQDQTQNKDAWQIDPMHSSAQFTVRHLGISTVRGAFTKVSGTILLDEANPAKDQIQATIDASSVDTRVEMRDNDLRSPNFLDVQKFPTITFKSKKVDPAGPGKLKIAGDLTIHGVTKEVVLDVDGPTPAIKDPWGNQRHGASASVKIIRQDFGVNGAPGVVGDELTLNIDVEFFKPPAK